MRNTIQEERIQDKYPSASILLEISMAEYIREKERTNTIEKKASTFISVIIAIFTLYIPIIPFSSLIKVYSNCNKECASLISICLFGMVLSIIFLVIGFLNLFTAYKISYTWRFEFSNLNDLNQLMSPENEVKKRAIDHYNEILNNSAKCNTEKANRVIKGMKYSSISFGILSISTIVLIIIIGGMQIVK